MKTIRTMVLVVGLAGALNTVAQSLPSSMYMGTSVPVSEGLRTIVIGPDTKHVNVEQDEVVKFVAGEVTFAWKFDGPGSRGFNLQLAAPSGALANPVKVYVQVKPYFR